MRDPQNRRGRSSLLLVKNFYTNFLIFGSIFFSNMLEGKDFRSSAAAKIGLLNYTISALEESFVGSELAMGLEWQYFTSKVNMIYLGYRTASDSKTQRTLYQASTFGARFFPITTGVPVESDHGMSKINYDFIFKPYLEGGLALGRYLVQTAGNPPVYDISSDFLGIALGTGMVIGLFHSLNLDLFLTYESDRGFNSPVAMTASTLHMGLGLVYFF